jgi:hypothetical protein
LEDSFLPAIRVEGHKITDPSGQGIPVLKCKYCGYMEMLPTVIARCVAAIKYRGGDGSRET